MDHEVILVHSSTIETISLRLGEAGEIQKSVRTLYIPPGGIRLIVGAFALKILTEGSFA